MFDRRDSERSAWRARSTSVLLLMVAVWFAACGEDGPVEPRNQAPLVSLAMPNLNVVIGTAATIDVSEYFADPDGDSLTYFAGSSDTAVAVAQVSGNGLAVHGVAQGRATITVTARDPSGLAATQEFDATVRNTDWTVLVSLFEAMNGRGWYRKSNWLSDEPIDAWQGVGVDATGRVDSLGLAGNNLKGTISPILGELPGLRALLLGGNRLSGPIPPALFELSSLTILDLRGNELEGSIAGRIRLLSALTHLDLSSNHLTGPIPDALGNLTSLTWLQLRDNDLTGPIPPILGELSGLQVLLLSSNELTGSIPAELGNLTSLSYLDLGNNQLTLPYS